jgi:hypothetical protein
MLVLVLMLALLPVTIAQLPTLGPQVVSETLALAAFLKSSLVLASMDARKLASSQLTRHLSTTVLHKTSALSPNPSATL